MFILHISGKIWCAEGESPNPVVDSLVVLSLEQNDAAKFYLEMLTETSHVHIPLEAIQEIGICSEPLSHLWKIILTIKIIKLKGA